MNDFPRSNNYRGDSNRGGGYPRRDFGRPSFGGGRDGGRRTMHPATCSECGSKCEIPFVPRDDRPVYCSNCFEKRGNSSDNGAPRRFERSGPPPAANFNNGGNNAEMRTKLDQINGKIDKILNLLLPIAESEKVLEEKAPAKAPEKTMEKKTEKVFATPEPVKAVKKSSAKKKKIEAKVV